MASVPLAARSQPLLLPIHVTVKGPKQVEAHGLAIWGHATRPGPADSPATRHLAWADSEDRGPWLRLHNGRRSILPARCGDAEAHERLAIVKRGQTLGFGALVLMLATIVTLAAIGQPLVVGIVATTGLAVIVAIFVTGEHQPAPVHSPEVAPPRPIRLPQQELPGVPPRGPEATNVRVI